MARQKSGQAQPAAQQGHARANARASRKVDPKRANEPQTTTRPKPRGPLRQRPRARSETLSAGKRAKSAATTTRPKSPLPSEQDRGASTRAPLLVGIGGCAGDLEAVTYLIERLPADGGCTCIVLLDQPARHGAGLVKRLAKHAKLPVAAAKHGLRLDASRIYVALAGQRVTVEHGRLCARAARGAERRRRPIDALFRSLAAEAGANAAGILLSGTSSDGTSGLAAIHEAGGLTLVQRPETTRQPGMPREAIAEQRAGDTLPPDEVPEALLRWAQRRTGLQTPQCAESAHEAALQSVLSLLHTHTGNDFSAYKRATLRRRVERRMRAHGLDTLEQYARLLQQTPYEVEALLREVLISVTSFFRDHDTFAALALELDKLLEAKPAEGGVVRGWIAGCATGEEAYSVAILVREACLRSGKRPGVLLFATDLDEQAVASARAGRYPASIASDVSAERLRRFFTQDSQGYRINPEVRDLVVFATQNVLTSPPFSKLDLVSCRNLLIYLESEAQRHALSLFAYALNPGGVLALGSCESLPELDDTFAPIDDPGRLYRRRATHAKAVRAVAPTWPASAASGLPTPAHGASAPVAAMASRSLSNRAVVERLLLTQLTPASAIVSERGELVYLHGQTSAFLRPARGEPRSNLFELARPGLRRQLTDALRTAAARGRTVTRRGVRVAMHGGHAAVMLVVRPLDQPELLRGTFLVTFELEVDAHRPAAQPRARAKQQGLRRLNAGSRRVHETLNLTIEELESANERLQDSNAALQAANEQLHSANEELETSREELQLLNAELQLANAEIDVRNHKLLQVNDDIQNLLEGMDAALLFLDDNLVVKRFTAQARHVFDLCDGDVGRPFRELAASLHYRDLLDDAREALARLVAREREVQTRSGAWRTLRVAPYCTHENLLDGLLITSFDIDRQKRAQLAAQARANDARAAFEAARAPLLLLDAELTIRGVSAGYCRRFGARSEEKLGKPLDQVANGRWNIPELLLRLRSVALSGEALDSLPIERDFAGLGRLRLQVSAERTVVDDERTFVVVTIDPLTAEGRSRAQQLVAG